MKVTNFLFGVSLMKNNVKKMLHLFVGILDILIFLLLVSVHMISLDKEWVLFVFILSKIQLTLNIVTQQKLVSWVLISTLLVLVFSLSVFMTEQFWYMISEINIKNLFIILLSEPKNIPTLFGKSDGTLISLRNIISIPFLVMVELWIGLLWKINLNPKKLFNLNSLEETAMKKLT